MCGKTEVKQNKFVEYISPAKGYFRETYKSQNIKHISPTPNFTLGPIHMPKIYTCKYFASWSKHTHVSKNIFNLRSHANSVHISIFKGTRTCCTAEMYKLLMAAAILFVHWSCT